MYKPLKNLTPRRDLNPGSYVSQSRSLSKLIHSFFRGKNGGTKICTPSLLLKKLSKENKKQKFAQSGHPFSGTFQKRLPSKKIGAMFFFRIPSYRIPKF
jgi:hypothetical protein